MAGALDLVSLADAKAQLNITSTGSDVELAGFISAATKPIERIVGPVIARPVTEVWDGGRYQLVLRKPPVLSVTSVTDSGTVLDPSSYKVDGPSGVLSRVAGPSLLPFLPGVQSVTVVYQAGRAADVAAVTATFPDIRLAALIIVQHLWQTQRPAAGNPFTQGGSDDYDPRSSFAVPRKVTELLGDPVGGFA